MTAIHALPACDWIARDAANAQADPRLAHYLLGALFLGVIALLSLPAARADSAALGWMPLWLLGMPLASLCALAVAHAPRFRLQRRHLQDASPVVRQRRPGVAQARRRTAPVARPRLPRAA